jgi:DNA-directed RNA polymerase specialized sigma24 family protein
MSRREVQFVLNLCGAPDRRAQQQNPKQPRPDILNRLHKLPPADQNLLNLALTGRHTFRQIANLVGSNAGSVCRRVTMLTKRLSHPLVIALLDRPLGLSEKFVHIGLQRHLFHQGIRRIALQTDCPEREVRSTLHYLDKWLRLSREMNDEARIKELKPIQKRHSSIQSSAQQHKGECECVTNP